MTNRRLCPIVRDADVVTPCTTIALSAKAIHEIFADRFEWPHRKCCLLKSLRLDSRHVPGRDEGI